MRYIPNTPDTLQKMLEEIKVGSVENLLRSIPSSLRLKEPLRIPEALSEPDLMRQVRKMTENSAGGRCLSFLGGGAYDHFIPSAVNHLASRSEFYTAYTPYQPEISQGTLQAIFEFQTLICQLTAMEVANASMYDGASALAEAVVMASRILPKRKKILLGRAIHPQYRQTIYTYCQYQDLVFEEIAYDGNGRTDLNKLKEELDDQVAAVVVGSPNYFGVIEDLKEVGELARNEGALFITAIAEPLSLGMVKAPGDFGADIVVGEGQSFGNPLNFGGPGVGFFATRNKHLRKMPGRLAGETVDKKGKRGFVLTLSTREQHIRREKATSNICTNQSLCALRATIYLTLLGRKGLKKVALQNRKKALYAIERLSAIEGCEPFFKGAVFNEFLLKVPGNAEEVRDRLLKEEILAGIPLGKEYEELENGLLICATENRTKEEIDQLATAIQKAI